MTSTIYLAVNAVIYLVFAVWCVIQPAQTSAFVGLQPVGGAGRSEFFAVYGGLEFGLAVIFALAAWRPGLQTAGLLVAACTYAGIVLFRSAAFLTQSAPGGNAWYIFPLEVTMAVLGVILVLPRLREL
jgi:hypothetical protein